MKQENENIVVYVVGNPRSGTTMLGFILHKHPMVYTFLELHFFDRMWDPRGRHRPLSRYEAIDLAQRLAGRGRRWGDTKRLFLGSPAYTPDVVDVDSQNDLCPVDIYKAFLCANTLEHGKTIPCEQTPNYVYYLPEILEAFPKARVVNIVRDPRDVLLSQKKRWRRYYHRPREITRTDALRLWMNYHPITASWLWRAAVKQALLFEGHPRVYSVRFEDILEDPERAVEDICSFIGITYQPEMLNIPMRGSSLVSDRQDQEGIDKARTGHWQNRGLNSAERFLCECINGNLMTKFRYPHQKSLPSLLLLLVCLCALPVKLIMTFLIHGGTFKNLADAVKRRLF